MTQHIDTEFGVTCRDNVKSKNAGQILRDLSPNARSIGAGATRKRARQAMKIDAQNITSTVLPHKYTRNSTISRHPKSLSDFTLFLKLPVELRLAIYDKMCDSPRIVEVLWNKDKRYYYTDSEVPLVLQICIESRTYAMRTYHKMFQGTTPTIAQHGNSGVRAFGAYINYSLDIVYITLRSAQKEDYRIMAENFLTSLEGNALSLIQHLAVDTIGTSLPMLSLDDQLMSLQSYILAISDVCLSRPNPPEQNIAPYNKAVKFAKRHVNDSYVCRWHWNQRRIVPEDAEGCFVDQFARWVKVFKHVLLEDYQDAKQVEALDFQILDVVRDKQTCECGDCGEYGNLVANAS